MARIRTIKPEFFFNERLAELEAETGLPVRLAYIGLWCQCDREGRFEWRPKRLKAQILPYDDTDFSRVLDALATRGFIEKYADEHGNEYGWIPGFLEHQVINNREAASVLPAPPKNTPDSRFNCDASATREAHVKGDGDTRDDACTREGKGKERKGKEELAREAPSGGGQQGGKNGAEPEPHGGSGTPWKGKMLSPTEVSEATVSLYPRTPEGLPENIAKLVYRAIHAFLLDGRGGEILAGIERYAAFIAAHPDRPVKGILNFLRDRDWTKPWTVKEESLAFTVRQKATEIALERVGDGTRWREFRDEAQGLVGSEGGS